MDVFTDRVLDAARASKLLVAIPFHYRPSRLAYVAEVVRTLAEFPIRKLTVVLLTNTAEHEELATVGSLLAPYDTPGKSFEVRSVAGLAEPQALCWASQTVLRNAFCDGRSDYTHFAYFEDDLRFSFQNFCYFLYGRDFLKLSGLLPSFVRVEFDERNSGMYSTDQQATMDYNGRPHIHDEGHVFVPIDSVYNATYILDQELADEYIGSRSSDPVRSSEMTIWGLSERASLGLSMENRPMHYYSRYVVPVDAVSRCPATCSWIYHLPNTYVKNISPDNLYGKLRIGELFEA